MKALEINWSKFVSLWSKIFSKQTLCYKIMFNSSQIRLNLIWFLCGFILFTNSKFNSMFTFAIICLFRSSSNFANYSLKSRYRPGFIWNRSFYLEFHHQHFVWHLLSDTRQHASRRSWSCLEEISSPSTRKDFLPCSTLVLQVRKVGGQRQIWYIEPSEQNSFRSVQQAATLEQNAFQCWRHRSRFLVFTRWKFCCSDAYIWGKQNLYACLHPD